ncbi:M28 family peptidase [Nocardia terpenica]|uniref:M28 family peptidase n=1 Tax=Nocardia terpenica TaxID=455432 RepID=A0A6G9Z7L8_9NOCA|nr:M28 family peptidase [Nocardia terpenica]QIS21589.1 M28 family peptidase [Nocardia terpenica]
MPGRRILGTLAAVAALTITPLPATAAPTETLADALAQAVTGPDAYRHLQVLQAIADANGGVRAVNTPGLAAAEDYVKTTLATAGYHPIVQDVPYTRFAVVAEDTRIVDGNTPLRTMVMDESPALSDVTAPAAPGPATGCQLGDYNGLNVGGAAVVLAAASCGVTQQVTVAAQAGARAVLLHSVTPDADTVQRLHWFGSAPPPIPLASISRSQAESLIARSRTQPIALRMNWQGHDEHGTTHTLIAETRGGSADHVAIVGAHLDSAADGPGINDDGSAVAATLQTAIQLAPYQDGVTDRVRFIWWGAAELADAGAEHHVAQLSSTDKQAIQAYLDATMIASPNFVRYVMSGPGVLSQPFDDYLTARQLPFEHAGTDVVASDHEPFAAAGITVGGIFAGSLGVKTDAQATRYGGTAGQSYDSCYRQPCDRLDRIDTTALDQNARALAYAVGWTAARNFP